MGIFVGSKVAISYNKKYDIEYMPESREIRKMLDKRSGVVIARHSSHGLCYDVSVQGVIGCFEPQELTRLN